MPAFSGTIRKLDALYFRWSRYANAPPLIPAERSRSQRRYQPSLTVEDDVTQQFLDPETGAQSLVLALLRCFGSRDILGGTDQRCCVPNNLKHAWTDFFYEQWTLRSKCDDK